MPFKDVVYTLMLILAGMNQVWSRARFHPMRYLDRDMPAVLIEETFNSAGQPSKLSAVILHPWQVAKHRDPLSTDNSPSIPLVRFVNLQSTLPPTIPATFSEPLNGISAKKFRNHTKRGRHNRGKTVDYQSDQTMPISTTVAVNETEASVSSESSTVSTLKSTSTQITPSQHTWKKFNRRRWKTLKNTKYLDSYNPLPYGASDSQQGSLPFARRPTQRGEPKKKPLIIGIPDSETDFSYASRWFKTLKEGHGPSSTAPSSSTVTPTASPSNTKKFWDVLRSVFSS